MLPLINKTKQAEQAIQRESSLKELLLSNSKSHTNISRKDLNISDQPGIISDKYEVAINNPIAKLSNEFCEAYEVINHTASASQNLYAIVFKKEAPIRFSEIMFLKNHMPLNMVHPIDFGVTRLNDEERFVIIMPIIKAKSLRDIINEGVKFEQKFIQKNIAPTILKALNTIHQNGFMHGKINSENIYIDANGEVLVGECFFEPCGFKQAPIFETIARSQTHLFGKGSHSNDSDLYALGVLIFALAASKDMYVFQNDTFIKEKLSSTTYGYLMNIKTIVGPIADLIRGLTNDDSKSRWGTLEVDNFLQGRSHNFNWPNDKNFLIRAITFNGSDYYSKRHLAHDLANNWEAAKSFLNTDKLVKWLASSKDEEKTIYAAKMILGNSVVKNSYADDEKLMKVIIILDPSGPIRIRDFSFNPDGIGSLMCMSFAYGDNETIKFLVNFLFLGTYIFYDFLAKIYQDQINIEFLSSLDRIRDCLKRSDIGYGIERVLYEMNPTLMSQTFQIDKRILLSSSDALEIIEQGTLSFEDITSSKHLVAFISAKNKGNKDFLIESLNKFPSLQKSRAIQLLAILCLAQDETRIDSLQRTCLIIKNALQDIIDLVLKSRSIRDDFKERIHVASESSNLKLMLKTMCDTRYYKRDEMGYIYAIRRGAEISAQIFQYFNAEQFHRDIRKRSLEFAIKFSYLASCFVIAIVIIKGWS